MLNNIKKILIIRLRFLGDILISTPVLRAIKEKYPEVHLSYLTEEIGVDILKNNPYVDNIIVFEKNKFQNLPLHKSLFDYIKFFKRLWDEKFDIVIDFFGNPRSALFTYISGAKYRLGINHKIRKHFYNILCNKTEAGTSAVDFYLSFLKKLSIEVTNKSLFLSLSPDEIECRENFYKENFKNNNLVIGLFVGGTHQSKIWQLENFARLSDRLICEYDFNVIIFGGPKEKDKISLIKQKVKEQAVFVSDVSVRELSAIISGCSVFITNDTGPMHIGVALGVPTIALFGPGEPDVWFPYLDNKKNFLIHNKLPCWPCHPEGYHCSEYSCIKMISVDDVIKTILRAVVNLGCSV
jgi:lipopolysaccharide heptosyltransferase II